MSKFKSKGGWHRIPQSFHYSLDGIIAALRYEAAFRQLCVLHLILCIIIFIADFTLNIKMLLLLASFISLIVELLNSAIEATVDYISLDTHPLAKRAKDLGSAAQLFSLVLIILLWLMALLM